MLNAMQAIKDKNVSVRKAAKLYDVPLTTLRDRVDGRCSVETVKSGPEPLFSQEEEVRLVNFVSYMAHLVLEVASDLAIYLGKRDRHHPLSMYWFYDFMGRWPELHVVKPRGLTAVREQSASPKVIDRYFVELKSTLTKYNLLDKPQSIYNLDEKEISTEHRPPNIVAKRCVSSQAITSPRGANTIIIGCGNALGQQIPLYYIFARKRMREELLSGCLPDTGGTVTDKGWSNSESGVYPFDPEAFDISKIAPSKTFEIYKGQSDSFSDLSLSNSTDKPTTISPHLPVPANKAAPLTEDFMDLNVKQYDLSDDSITLPNVDEFLQSKCVLPASLDQPKRKKRKTVHQIVSGKAIIEDNVVQELKKFKNSMSSKNTKSNDVKFIQRKKSKKKENSIADHSPQPGPSSYYVTASDEDVDSSIDSDEEPDSSKCCVCHKNSPPALRECLNLTIVKWAQCDRCQHWTHLHFCSKVSTVRRHSEFLCPCCEHSDHAKAWFQNFSIKLHRSL
ncbi:hypothetical protein KUTeg_012120 [Tegillarca granosa]|uniref:HTH psq-type domain-containing protein n=1 Tax=Tegillarca granosa TaxID=220873 RepID=A0ABQ9F251_TEGGR|nr:hypothetical protein KUTeg_012120 [Tegillarca granosa]